MFNGAKFKMKVDFDKGEDYREIPTRDILEKFTTEGFADVLSGGVLLEPQWVFSVLVVLLI